MQPHIVVGSLEYIMLTWVGSGFAVLFQWLWLQSMALRSTKWVGYRITGIVIGVVLSTAVITDLGMFMTGTIQAIQQISSWAATALEVWILALITKLSASLKSGKALFESVIEPFLD